MWHDRTFSQNKGHQKQNWREGWSQHERGVGQNFKKVGQAIEEGLHNIGSFKNPLPTVNHKELFWKKGVIIAQRKP